MTSRAETSAGTTAIVAAARRALGPVGVFLPVPTTSAPSVDLQRDAARRLERAGYRAAWTNEVIGKDALVQLAVLLSRAAGGLGRSGRPLATMRAYLEQMAAPAQLPVPGAAYPRIIGANGPKMLALAGEISDGAMPAMVQPDATAQARRLLGPGKLLVILMDGSAERGDASTITAMVREHLAAGADHVTVGMPIGTDFAAGVAHLEQLAPAVLGPGDDVRA
jgi:hypothetical protein